MPRHPEPLEVRKARTAAANEASRRAAALRALDDPVKLARAARIVRAALERGRLEVADVVPGADTDDAGPDELAG
jgi:hypothetical protein